MKTGIRLLAVFVPSIAILAACAGPHYVPGKIKDRKDAAQFLKPPFQVNTKPGYYLLEPGIEIYHFESGAGDDVLVLHGGPGYPPVRPWAGLELLKNSFRFVYYHQRGCGKSTRPVDRFDPRSYYKDVIGLTGQLGFTTQLADIERIRRLLGKEKITLIGHSFGGFIAALYAVEFPERVKKLVLVAPADVIKMPQDGGGLYEQVRQLLPDGESKRKYDGFLKKYFDYGSIFDKSEYDLMGLNNAFVPFYALAYKMKGLDYDVNGFQTALTGGWLPHALYFDMGQAHDYSAAFRRISCPVLLVWGDKDISPPSCGAQYTACISNTLLSVIKGAGHFVYDEKPAEFAAVVGDFLKD